MTRLTLVTPAHTLLLRRRLPRERAIRGPWVADLYALGVEIDSSPVFRKLDMFLLFSCSILNCMINLTNNPDIPSDSAFMLREGDNVYLA